MQEFVKQLCATVLRATVAAHRLPVALHLMHCMGGVCRTSIPAALAIEWTFFLTGAAMGGASVSAPGSGSIPHWVPTSARERFSALADSLPGIIEASRFDDSSAWTEWLAAAAPESAPPVACTLTKFQQVILAQVRFFFQATPVSSAFLLVCKLCNVP